MRRTPSFRALLLAGGGALVAAWGCREETAAPPAEVTRLLATSDSVAVTERALALDPTLRLRLGTAVFLDLEPAGGAVDPDRDTGGAGADTVPYDVARAEDVRLCLRDLGDAVSEVTLTDAQGRVALRAARGAECAEATLAPGAYVARIVSGAAAAPTHVFVHDAGPTDRPPQCAPELRVPDATVGGADDVWLLVTETQRIQADPLVRTTRGTFDPAQGFKVFRIEDGSVRFRTANGKAVFPSGGLVSAVAFNPNDHWTANYGLVKYGFTPVPDGAKWTFHIAALPGDFTPWAIPNYSPTWVASTMLSATRARITMAMRRSPHGERAVLRAGEVALFDGAGCTGPAWIFNDSNAFPTDLAAIPGWSALRSARSGCDATFVAASQRDGGGTVVRYGSDTCVPITAPVATGRVASTRQLVVETTTCTDCNLRNVDLRGSRLEGLKLVGGSAAGGRFDGVVAPRAAFTRVDLTGAAFDGATLSGAQLTDLHVDGGSMLDAKLDGATLTSVSLDRVPLDRATFEGATLKHVAFTNTDLRLARFDASTRFAFLDGNGLPASPCTTPLREDLPLTRLAGSRFKIEQIPVTAWASIDFRGLRDVDLSGVPVAQRRLENLNFCGHRLGGLVLDHYKLGQSRFDEADLTGAVFTNVDLSFATFKHATLNRASLQYSDLTGATLDEVIADSDATAVTLDGTLFAPASLRGAHFTRVQMNGATVKMPLGDAHVGALFDGGFFDGTDFTGSDLSGLSMTGGTFTHAIFDHANLYQTKLGRGSRQSLFRNAIFCGAKVGGADFSGAVLTDALFPSDEVTLPDQDDVGHTPRGDAGARVSCARVDLNGAGTLDAAVTTTGATCPDSRTPPTGGCVGADWIPANAEPRPACPARRDGGIGPAKISACYPCTSNCACASLRCIGGVCARCFGDGGT